MCDIYDKWLGAKITPVTFTGGITCQPHCSLLKLLWFFVNACDWLIAVFLGVSGCYTKEKVSSCEKWLGHSNAPTQPLMHSSVHVYYSHSHSSIITRHQKMGSYTHRAGMWYVYECEREWWRVQPREEHPNLWTGLRAGGRWEVLLNSQWKGPPWAKLPHPFLTPIQVSLGQESIRHTCIKFPCPYQLWC